MKYMVVDQRTWSAAFKRLYSSLSREKSIPCGPKFAMGARIRLIAVLFALIALVLLESGPAARSLDVARVSRVPSGILFVRAASEEPAAAANANAEDEDDEEEDDSGPKAAPRKAGAKPEAPRRTATWGEFLSTIPWNKFYLDFVALGLVVIYYLNSFRGSSANEKIAKNWYKLTSNVWREQFAVLGDKDGNTLMVI